ncbi:MAG TPA: hypothetical protein VNQ34_04710 [Xanthobacteraceae bacterium]|jgi:hypothetical protein|nr:hypothetical protein [Xanthobacteraceae bacterium]
MRNFLPIAALLLAAGLVPAWVPPAAAQSPDTQSANARLGGGQSVKVSAVSPAEGATYLEIALPEGAQKLEGLGERFLPIVTGGRTVSIAAADLSGDSIDEIVVRGQVTGSSGALVVLRWDAAQKQFLPVDFIDDRDEKKPFLFTDNKSTVSLAKGGVEVKVTRVDQSGRSAAVLEKYRWDNGTLKYSEDH